MIASWCLYVYGVLASVESWPLIRVPRLYALMKNGNVFSNDKLSIYKLGFWKLWAEK